MQQLPQSNGIKWLANLTCTSALESSVICLSSCVNVFSIEWFHSTYKVTTTRVLRQFNDTVACWCAVTPHQESAAENVSQIWKFQLPCHDCPSYAEPNGSAADIFLKHITQRIMWEKLHTVCFQTSLYTYIENTKSSWRMRFIRFRTHVACVTKGLKMWFCSYWNTRVTSRLTTCEL